jgi:hypothetical protein
MTTLRPQMSTIVMYCAAWCCIVFSSCTRWHLPGAHRALHKTTNASTEMVVPLSHCVVLWPTRRGGSSGPRAAMGLSPKRTQCSTHTPAQVFARGQGLDRLNGASMRSSKVHVPTTWQPEPLRRPRTSDDMDRTAGLARFPRRLAAQPIPIDPSKPPLGPLAIHPSTRTIILLPSFLLIFSASLHPRPLSDLL